MSYKGYMNPSDLQCWSLCNSCLRCGDKGKYAKCNECSGRHDVELHKDPYYIDDRCRCKEGVLQYRTKVGRWIVSKFQTNPFKGKVQVQQKSTDERDFDSYVNEQRELLNIPDWSPIEITSR